MLGLANAPLNSDLPLTERDEGAVRQYVTFRSAGRHFAAGIMQVQEIRSWQEITSLPRRVAASRGVLDIRGRIVEVYDLNLLMGEDRLPPDKSSVILILNLEDRALGLLVEAVSDIIQVEPGADMAIPDDMAQTHPTCITSIINHDGTLIALVDIAALMALH